MALFYNLIDVSAFNAFVLVPGRVRSRDQSVKRRLFLEELGRMLVYPRMQRRGRLPRTPAAAAMVKSQQIAEKAKASGAADTRKRRRACRCCADKKETFRPPAQNVALTFVGMPSHSAAEHPPPSTHTLSFLHHVCVFWSILKCDMFSKVVGIVESLGVERFCVCIVFDIKIRFLH